MTGWWRPKKGVTPGSSTTRGTIQGRSDGERERERAATGRKYWIGMDVVVRCSPLREWVLERGRTDDTTKRRWSIWGREGQTRRDPGLCVGREQSTLELRPDNAVHLPSEPRGQRENAWADGRKGLLRHFLACRTNSLSHFQSKQTAPSRGCERTRQPRSQGSSQGSSLQWQSGHRDGVWSNQGMPSLSLAIRGQGCLAWSQSVGPAEHSVTTT